MPELPEVEIVRTKLHALLAGRHIVAVRVEDPLLVGHADAKDIEQRLTARSVNGLRRRGKYLLFDRSRAAGPLL